MSALWLVLSGYFDSLLLWLGAGSVALVVWIAHRMDVADHEGHPIYLTWRALLYWPWLIWEIVKSNIDCGKIVLSPKMRYRISMIDVKASQKSELGQVIYANSITLTPGTVTMELVDGKIGVHCLDDIFRDGLLTGEMDRRCAGVVGDERFVEEQAAEQLEAQQQPLPLEAGQPAAVTENVEPEAKG